jgi:hypothetical protein
VFTSYGQGLVLARVRRAAGRPGRVLDGLAARAAGVYPRVPGGSNVPMSAAS